MGVHNMTLEDLKKQRPDLYQAIKLEVCLGELRLTKDDIISLIDPLSENIKNHLKPYLPKLRTKTYNDIVDMENDIIDEISEQLLNEFEELEHIVGLRPKRKIKYVPKPVSAIKDTLESNTEDAKLDLMAATLEDLKKHRPDLCDLLYDEYLKTHPLDMPKIPEISKEEKEKGVNEINGVKKGDAIRWNYTKEEGIVVGFEDEDGISNIIVRRYNGTKVLFENDPKLFTILEGVEKDNVIFKRKQFLSESKETKETGRTIIPKKSPKSKTIYDGVMYNEPTRRGSKLKVGDHIRFKLTKGLGVVKGFMRRGGLDRIIMGKSEGLPESIIDNPEAYEIIDNKTRKNISGVNLSLDSAKPKNPSKYKKEVRKARIGDMVELNTDGIVGKVVEIKDTGYGIERIILELEDGSEYDVFNDTSMYYVLIGQ